MRKCGTEICTVDIRLACTFGEEEPVTSRTKYVNCIISGEIGKSNRKHGLSLAKHSRTSPEGCRPVFLVHCVHTPVGHNITVAEFVFKMKQMRKKYILFRFWYRQTVESKRKRQEHSFFLPCVNEPVQHFCC